MKFSKLVKNIPGIVAVSAGSDPEVLRVCEDSRKARAGDLFVARGGTRTDGAKFAADAVARGAVAVVAAGSMEVPPGVAFAQASDAALALPLLAHRVAGDPTAAMRMLAVTGTKGKTTVAYLMRSILRAAGHTCGLVGTVEIDDGAEVRESEMTTPGAAELVDCFARMKLNGVTHCIMETSSHALHQHRVAGIGFSLGMYTNLSHEHIDYHKTMEGYAAAKALLFEDLPADGVAVINIDDAHAARMVRDCRAKVVPYCLSRPEDPRPAPVGGWLGTIRQMDSGGMVLEVLSAAGESFQLRTPLVGRHNGYNLLCVIAAARALGVPTQTVIGALEGNVGAPGRLEPVVPEGKDRTSLPFQVFVDYAHTHDSLENVLSALRGTMKTEGRTGRLVCVFGCGGDRDRAKRPMMAAVAEKLADTVVVTSDNPRTEEPGAIIEEIKKGFSATANGKVKVEADRREAIRVAIGTAGPGDVVLIAGKGHENYQIIGTTKTHFDDVEEAARAMAEKS